MATARIPSLTAILIAGAVLLILLEAQLVLANVLHGRLSMFVLLALSIAQAGTVALALMGLSRSDPVSIAYVWLALLLLAIAGISFIDYVTRNPPLTPRNDRPAASAPPGTLRGTTLQGTIGGASSFTTSSNSIPALNASLSLNVPRHK